jgi:ferredoxin
MSEDIEYNEELTEQIKKIVKKLGADKVGIAKASLSFKPPHGHADPHNLVEDPKAYISFAIKIPDSICEANNEDDLVQAGGFITVQNKLHGKISQMALQIAQFLEKLDYNAFPTSPIAFDESKNIWPGVISQKHIAQMAGLGEVGQSNLFLTPEWGPRILLGSVLTDAPLKPDGPKLVDKVCLKCNACVQACPTRALGAENYPPFNFDLNRCLWGVQGWYRLTKVEEPPEDWTTAKPNAKIMVPKYEKKYPQIAVYQQQSQRLGNYPFCQECLIACKIGKDAYKEKMGIEE